MEFRFEWHPTLDGLEQYAMGRAADPVLERTEEHLLVCESCRSELSALEQELRVLRTVLRQANPNVFVH